MGAWALDPSLRLTQYVQRHWDTNDGLPQIAVLQIAQGVDGFLWFSTQDGLARFDGLDFKVFNSATYPHMTENSMWAIHPDPSGAIWVGTTSNGLLYLNSATSSPRRVGWKGAPRSIRVIERDPWDRLWLGGLDGLACLDFKDRASLVPKVILSTEEWAVQSIMCDDQKRLWVGTDTGRLFYFEDARPDRRVDIETFTEWPIRALLQDRRGRILAGSYGGGPFLVENGRGTPLSSDLEQHRILDIGEDRDGTLWFAAGDHGLIRMVGDTLVEDTPNPFASKDICAVAEDREGNLWVGSFVNGLYQLRNSRFVPFTQSEGIPSRYTWVVYPDREGRVWITGQYDGVARIQEGRIGVWTERDGMPEGSVTVVIQDSADRFWIGSHTQLVVGPADGPFTLVASPEGGDFGRVNTLCEDDEGNIWVGRGRDGLVRIHPRTLAKTVFLPDESFPMTICSALYTDREGTIWVGSYNNGLGRIRDGVRESFRDRAGLESRQILAISEDRSGALWLATGSGICRYEDDRFQCLAERDGLPDTTIFSIVEDPRGDAWMSSNRGIWRIPMDDLHAYLDGRIQRFSVERFGPADGMRTRECSWGGFPNQGFDTDGNLWFATAFGVLRTHPDYRPPDMPTPTTLLTSWSVDGKEKALTLNALAPNMNDIQFDFTAATFIHPATTGFRYRLQGYDPNWIWAGSRRSAFYTNLPPGDYRFQVQAMPQGGATASPATLAFHLRPAYYQTKPFQFLVAASLFMLGVGINNLRLRGLRKRKEELEVLVAERTHSLRQAYDSLQEAQHQLVATAHASGMSEIATNILHELGNRLNSAQTSVALIHQQLGDLPVDRLRRLQELIEKNMREDRGFFQLPGKLEQVAAFLDAVSQALGSHRQEMEREAEELRTMMSEMNRVIQHQQTYSQAGRFFENVVVAPLVQQAVDSQSQPESAVVQMNLAETSPVRAQKHKLLEVMKILLLGCRLGLEAAARPGRLRIATADAADGRVCVLLAHDGRGCRPQDLPRVFSQGFMERQIGFDLHFCAIAIEEMEGRLEVHSDGENQGMQFEILLPTAEG